jgi:hypothetical protein
MKDKEIRKQKIAKKTLEKRISADRKKIKKVVALAKSSLHKTTKKVNSAVKSL